jgi:hypothetical protein
MTAIEGRHSAAGRGSGRGGVTSRRCGYQESTSLLTMRSAPDGARRENVMNLGIGLLIIVGAWTLLSVLVSVTVGGMAEGRDAGRPSAERALRQRREADSAERLVS